METIEVPANGNETVAKKHMLLLPYQEDEDISLTIFFFFLINKHLPSNVKMQVTFTGQNLTDRTKFEHKHRDIILASFQKKTVLITVLLILLAEYLSEF